MGVSTMGSVPAEQPFDEDAERRHHELCVCLLMVARAAGSAPGSVDPDFMGELAGLDAALKHAFLERMGIEDK